MKLPETLRGPLFGLPILIMLAASGCLPGCAQPHNAPSPRATPGVHTYAGVDDSVGMEPHLGQETNLLTALNGRLDPDKDFLTLLRVNYAATEFFNDPPPDSTEELRGLLLRTFRARPARDGTRPAQFFREIARRTAHETRTTVVVYLSDGDQDFPAAQEEPALQSAGKSLAGTPNVKAVILCGASPENWAAWRRRFAMLDDSGRLHLVPLDRGALNKISAYITAAGCRSGRGDAAAL